MKPIKTWNGNWRTSSAMTRKQFKEYAMRVNINNKIRCGENTRSGENTGTYLLKFEVKTFKLHCITVSMMFHVNVLVRRIWKEENERHDGFSVSAAAAAAAAAGSDDSSDVTSELG